MSDTYDKINHWYGWNGGGCPVSATAVVEVMGHEGKESGPAGSFIWSMTDFIIAFRIISLAPQTIKREVALYQNVQTPAKWLYAAEGPGFAGDPRVSEVVLVEFTLLGDGT